MLMNVELKIENWLIINLMIKDYYDIINPYNQRIIGQAPIHSKDYVIRYQKHLSINDLTASQRLSLTALVVLLLIKKDYLINFKRRALKNLIMK